MIEQRNSSHRALLKTMHLNNYANRHELLIDWIIESTPKGASILDIGANDGSFCPEVRRIAAHAGLYAGVDPDAEKLAKHPLLQQRFPATLETADIPANSFDCVLAIYVLEHVADDVGFMQAVARVLKPGGSFYFITPNGDHYFAAIAGALARIGLQERVLRLIRPRQLVGKYHYPALYRLNSAAKLRRMGKPMGLGSADFRYSEHFDEFACYFPGPTKLFPWAWEKMVQGLDTERLLGNLMGRMTKNAAPCANTQCAGAYYLGKTLQFDRQDPGTATKVQLEQRHHFDLQTWLSPLRTRDASVTLA